MEIVVTDDGSLSAHHKVLGDLYHSSRGAVGEAQYVYVENGLNYFLNNTPKENITVFDMGLGTSLNAWLTLQQSSASKKIKYYAIEKYPLSYDEQLLFRYSTLKIYEELLYAPWNKDVQITSDFSIHKITGDVLEFDFADIRPIDVVYWDAFSPDSQPSLWSVELFSRIWSAMSQNAVLTTYSAKGTVKQALRDSGFVVNRLKGALGKRHMIRALR